MDLLHLIFSQLNFCINFLYHVALICISYKSPHKCNDCSWNCKNAIRRKYFIDKATDMDYTKINSLFPFCNKLDLKRPGY